MKFENKLTGYQAKIAYWGANHSKNQEPPTQERWLTTIKIEITLYEIMVFELVLKKNHPYSDSLIEDSTEISCYNLKEVISEKIRALVQRSYTAPRDYYDIYILKDLFNKKDWKEIKIAFLEKMRFKGIEYKDVEQLINDKSSKTIKKAWDSSLKHQIPKEKLPDVKLVVKELKEILNNNL